jgi:hypothetical protein
MNTASFSQKIRINSDAGMGRRSKAVQLELRIKNFNQPPKNQRARVDDIIDSDDEDYFPSESNHPEDPQVRKDISDDYGFISFDNYEGPYM